MSKIEDLIKQYCPDGVEWKTVGECVRILDGQRKPITKAARVAGKYPYYGANGVQDYVADYIFNGIYVLIGEDGSVVTPEGHPIVHWVEGKIWVNNHAHVVEEIQGVSLRYFFYAISNCNVSNLIHGNIPKLNQSDFKAIMIPVPHIAVQDEIVRILDKFTELEKELEKELELRRKQYEFYRDKLLTFDGGVEWKKLGEIMTIQRGASPRPILKYITEDSNGVNWIKIGDTSVDSKYVVSCAEKITQEGAKKSRFLKAGSFILSNSMSFGRPYILKIDGCIHDGWISMTDFENVITPDFLYHVLMSSVIQYEMRQKASNGGAVSNLNSDIVKSIEIPIPSPTEQERIVKILDKFDILTTNLTSGLPAEIKLRHQQYEYYRDYLFGLLK